MDNYEGDLADIFRDSGGIIKTNTTTNTTNMPDWQFGSSNPDLCLFPEPFHNTAGSVHVGVVEDSQSAFYADGNFNIFPRALQISQEDMHSWRTRSNNSNIADKNSLEILPPAAGKPPRVSKTAYEMMTSCGGGFLESSSSGIQIPALRNPGIKRRKSQAKKVVCIAAAPSGTNNRQSGEVVPSDLWAWRKYGQKPIKGSPYPRGYYRCSSSKGCSARKQVERSRMDPNMLVITYTSEHNHPWPTHRNALASSTQSQPPKPTHEVPVKGEVVNTTNKEIRLQNTENNSIMSESDGMQSQQDYFTELGFECDDDPLNFMFTQESKTLDPFSALFDWGAPNRTTTMVEVQVNEDEHVKKVS